MTIGEAKGIFAEIKTRLSDESVRQRIESLIKDLSELFGHGDQIDDDIAGQIRKVGNDLTLGTSCVNYEWVMKLSEAFINMKRRSDCIAYYHNNPEAVKKQIDGETWSKGVTIITALITLIIICVGVGLYCYGIGLDDGKFNYDFWSFMITVAGVLIAIIGWVVGAVWNYKHRRKCADEPYSIDELLAVRYKEDEKKFRLPGVISPEAKNIAENSKGKKLSLELNDIYIATNIVNQSGNYNNQTNNF